MKRGVIAKSSNHSPLFRKSFALTNAPVNRSPFFLAAVVTAMIVATLVPTLALADEPEPFHVKSFSSHTTDAAGDDYTVSGGHPFQNVTQFDFPSHPGTLGESPVEYLKDVAVDLPVGFFGNPAAVSRCPVGNIGQRPSETNCPLGSKVGNAKVNPVGGGFPLYSVKPDYGFPAQFMFNYINRKVPLYVTSLPRTESYGLTVGTRDATRYYSVLGPITTFCSYTTQVSGDECVAPSGSTAPFLSNPVDCSDADPIWRIAIDSWENPGLNLPNGLPDLGDPNWKTATTPASPVTECDAPQLASQFHPAIDVKPLQNGGPIQADQPSGLAVDLDFPQSNDPTDPDTTYDPSLPQAPEPKHITVKLPAGLAISPSSADGLGACSDLASDSAGDQVHYDTTQPVTCPDSSKIGSAVATSPLLATHDPVTDEVNGAEPIPGDVYLLEPHPGDLPIGGGSQEGKFRLLIQLENARYGVNFKLPGVAVADKQTGQLTTVFTDNPQLPSKHLTVTLKPGARAPLATPVTCGKFETTTDFVPWSTPGTPDANPTASFDVGSGPNGTGCVSAAAQRPFAPTMSAGAESSKAGAKTPFVLHLARADGEQELSSLEATLPKGLGAKFAGVPYCPDAVLDAAAGRSGTAELANPSCPASRIGAVTVGAGPGPNPYNTKGSAYLAGPYKGAPMSVAVITPAVAGPFDLGTVVVRNALYVNPVTAQGRVVSDSFPEPDQLQPAGDHRQADLHRRRGLKPLQRLPGLGLRQARLQARPQAEPQGRHQAQWLPGPESDPELPQGQLRQHRQGDRLIAPQRVPRPKPHQDDLHQGPVRRRHLPQRLDLRLRHRDHAAARRTARRPALPQELLQPAARPGRGPARPDRRRPGRPHRQP